MLTHSCAWGNCLIQRVRTGVIRAMSPRPSKNKTARLTTKPDGQLSLQFGSPYESGRIPEPKRSQCVDLLRKMLRCVIDEPKQTIPKNER